MGREGQAGQTGVMSSVASLECGPLNIEVNESSSELLDSCSSNQEQTEGVGGTALAIQSSITRSHIRQDGSARFLRVVINGG